MFDIKKLPKSVYSGEYAKGGHVQGIATDGEFMYFSFTTFLLKTDMSGTPVGSVDGLLGHLGCIAFQDGYVYGSLEYKNDMIGKGILKKQGYTEQLPDAFYIARFDVSKIDRMGMDAQNDGVLGVLRLSDVCEDYEYPGHRYGCSGIDGITCCRYPDDRLCIYVAYGIYSDTGRDDNDNQILLQFDYDRIKDSFSVLCQTNAENANSVTADKKIFVFTGNTTFGIQNLEYDPASDKLIAAVYEGCKPQFINYPMFIIDLKSDCKKDGKELYYGENAVKGEKFEHGSTGIVALGGGYYYFSRDGKNERGYYSDVHMYKRSPDGFTEA